MTLEQDEMSTELYAEFYSISQDATRAALKNYDLSAVDRESLVLDTKKNKKSLVYKLFTTNGFSKTLIATTKVSTVTKSASVKITNLSLKY